MRTRWSLGMAVVLALASPLGARAQSPPRSPAPPTGQPQDAELLKLRQQVEMWIRSGQPDRAIEVLERRRKEEGLDLGLRRRLASLYREAGRYADLEALVLEQSQGDLSRADLGELRLLAEARYRQGRDEAAWEALEAVLAGDPHDAGRLRMVASVLAQNRHPGQAIEVLEDARAAASDPTLFAQMLARIHTQLDQPVRAVEEYAKMIVGNPLNISLVRNQVLQLADRWPESLEEFIDAMGSAQASHPQVGQLSLIVAELQLRAGHPEEAWQSLEVHLSDPNMAQDLLRLALAGLADGRSGAEDDETALQGLRLSARIARGLLDRGALPRSLQPRAWDTLTRTLMALLENPAFAQQDSRRQLEMLEKTREAILTMQREFSGNRLSAVALLRLAELYSTSLHRPRRAIEIYRSVRDDPNSTRENLQVARMGLAQSYVALGDTATARGLFEEMGQDMGFVEGQGRAHYYLGQLDFMAGDFARAEDRLKAVAAESPRADYANDALDLALVLAEEKMSGATDEAALGHYGAMLYHRSVADRRAMREDLEAILNGEGRTPLRMRARLDLARLEFDDGDAEAALAELDLLLREAPSSRRVPEALEWKGEVLESLGREGEAMKVYEQLLVDHGDYVQLDRIRDRIRDLESRGIGLATEEELP